ncbi:MAG TPA: hypothetical protein VMP68_19720, partial [Candidatus Eisenbacteria bacterium]|nr:hypothetical protein [Candidatus Eisenbacteria bacterium]
QDLLARSEAKGGYSKEIFSLVALELWHRAFMADVKPAHRGSRSSHVLPQEAIPQESAHPLFLVSSKPICA